MKKKLKQIPRIDPLFKVKIKNLFEEMHASYALLYEIATRDEKTGLYNNKFFETELDKEIEKAQRGYQKLSLMILDIDHFKKINDAYGHIRADEVLARLARVVYESTRLSDVVARFGGEEFTILLPETSLVKAKKLSIRLRNKIKSDRTLKKFNISVSGGITEYKKKDSKKTFKSRADKALYKAKNSGRDKFVCA